MFRFLIISLFLFSIFTAKAEVQWNRQKVFTTYKLTESLKIKSDTKVISLKKDSNLELVEVSELSMIKVFLHKYKVTPCPNKKFVTDLQLIEVKQDEQDSIVVGVNMAKNCQLEVFIDVNEYNLKSFVK